MQLIAPPAISSLPATTPEPLHDLEKAFGQLSPVWFEHKVSQVVCIATPEKTRLLSLPWDLDLSDYAGQQVCLMKCDGKVLARRVGA